MIPTQIPWLQQMLGAPIYKSDQINLLKSRREKVNGVKAKIEQAGY